VSTRAAVRHAESRDLDALVRLRLENARVHVDLEPDVYRVPEVTAVRDYFHGLLQKVPRRGAGFVADVGDHVAGSVELVPYAEPPDHQILRPVPSAYVHTVVDAGARGAGLGTLLLGAAEAWAAREGIERLVAGIAQANEPALRFYAGSGFSVQGVSAVKRLPSVSSP
jgi:GNAT superfamily N-acetyltransferase